MMIAPSAMLEVLEVIAGGGHGAVANLEHPRQPGRGAGGPDGDAARAPPLSFRDRVEVAPHVDYGSGDPVGAQRLRGEIHAVALGDAPQVDLRVRLGEPDDGRPPPAVELQAPVQAAGG